MKIVIAVAAALAVTLLSCDCVKKYYTDGLDKYGIPHDNAFEQAGEFFIKEQTGFDIDMSLENVVIDEDGDI